MNALNPSMDSTLLGSLGVMESQPTTCPRCHDDLGGAEFYGVCESCAINLRAVYNGQPRADVEAVAYEPKMNVTPNAVASKE